MPARRFAHKPPVNLCFEVDADDGVDPRLAPRHFHGKVVNRKALQLCRQVEHALAGALEGEILRDLTVWSVVPAPDSSRLLATLVFQGPESVATSAVLDSLRTASSPLRSAVALAIHRKKTPQLAFHVVRSVPTRSARDLPIGIS